MLNKIGHYFECFFPHSSRDSIDKQQRQPITLTLSTSATDTFSMTTSINSDSSGTASIDEQLDDFGHEATINDDQLFLLDGYSKRARNCNEITILNENNSDYYNEQITYDTHDRNASSTHEWPFNSGSKPIPFPASESSYPSENETYERDVEYYTNSTWGMYARIMDYRAKAQKQEEEEEERMAADTTSIRKIKRTNNLKKFDRIKKNKVQPVFDKRTANEIDNEVFYIEI